MTSELAYQLEDDLAAAVEAIRVDAVSGPIALARLGVASVLRLTEKAHYERPLHIWMEVQGLARALFAARPECMPLVHLASAIVEPLPELYGRGKDEGARMRADVRLRALAWLSAMDARAARIDVLRSSMGVAVVSAHAVNADTVFVDGPISNVKFAIAGVEKLIPPNYTFVAPDLERIPLDDFEGILTGDTDAPATIESVRQTIASLRFAPTLL